jgi:hypothetical protein
MFTLTYETKKPGLGCSFVKKIPIFENIHHHIKHVLRLLPHAYGLVLVKLNNYTFSKVVLSNWYSRAIYLFTLPLAAFVARTTQTTKQRTKISTKYCTTHPT